MDLKKKMYGICPTFVLIVLCSAVLIFGGAEKVSAQEDRFMYEMIVTNNASKVTTVMQVYAANEKDAKENVSANGWTVHSIKQLTYRTAEPIDLNQPLTVTVPQEMARPLAPEKPKENLTDEQLIESILGKPVPEPQPVIAAPQLAAPLIPDEDLLALTPNYGDLTLRYIVYFDLGIITPRVTLADDTAFKGFNKNTGYYLAGHTDNVSVGANAPYKDNFELSFKRAEAVKEVLSTYGINPASVNTVGYGSLYTAVKNTSSPEGTVQNRRVEIYEVRKTD